MEETYAHELEGQTVIISSMSDEQGKRKPVGYALQVKLLNGVKIQNVTRVDFEPILPNQPVFATLTLAHIEGGNLREEQVRVQTYVDIPAIVKEERHTNE